MCRAQGVPHQRVTSPDDLPRALRAAWGLNRHSVVEVVTSRGDNFDLHRALQAEVAAAVRHAHALMTAATGSGAAAGGGAAAAAPRLLAPLLAVARASVSSYRAPLARPVTTGARGGAREGALLTVTLVTPSGDEFHGIGEAAPLPGLSAETADEAAAQLRAVAELLRGATPPAALPLLGSGAFGSWLRAGLGVPPEALLPSARAALECALLSALAAARGCPLADLIAGGGAAGAAAATQTHPPTAGRREVRLNALLAASAGPPAAAAAEAAALAAAGFGAIKVKVARRDDPIEDAEVLLAIRAAVGPGVALRADANRGWSLEQALAFGRRAAAAGLEYVEEPTADPADMAAFFLETGA